MSLKIMAIAKPDKEPDVDKQFMNDPNVPQEKKDEELASAKIPYLNLIKHFPYHNEDWSILVDVEFGKELGWEYQDPSKVDELRETCYSHPNLQHMVRIPGKGFFREVAVCSTVEKANEIRDKIMALDKIEEVTAKKRHYEKKIKKVVGKSL